MTVPQMSAVRTSISPSLSRSEIQVLRLNAESERVAWIPHTRYRELGRAGQGASEEVQGPF